MGQTSHKVIKDNISHLYKAVGCPAAAMWLTWEFPPPPVCRIPPDVQMEYAAVFAWFSVHGNADVCVIKYTYLSPVSVIL
jgi:hypothetical protein